MTDAVTPVAASPALQPAPTRATVPAAASLSPVSDASPASDPAPQPSHEPQRQPFTVDVQNESGIFVYTLCDPVTDKVLAVIPDDTVSPGGGAGRHVDQKV